MYTDVIPAAQHQPIGKLARKTNHIERFNNTLRQRVSRLVRSPIRKEVSHYLQQYVPLVESGASPLLGSSDVIESLIGKATQRLEANGHSELNKSILLVPCMCGELIQELVAEALTTVRVQDVTTWVSEEVGETMQSVRRRELGRRQPQKPETKTAELFADTG